MTDNDLPYTCDGCGQQTLECPGLGDCCKLCGSSEFTLTDELTENNSEFHRGVRIAVKTIREQIARYSLEDILEALELTADSREGEKRND